MRKRLKKISSVIMAMAIAAIATTMPSVAMAADEKPNLQLKKSSEWTGLEISQPTKWDDKPSIPSTKYVGQKITVKGSTDTLQNPTIVVEVMSTKIGKNYVKESDLLTKSRNKDGSVTITPLKAGYASFNVYPEENKKLVLTFNTTFKSYKNGKNTTSAKADDIGTITVYRPDGKTLTYKKYAQSKYGTYVSNIGCTLTSACSAMSAYGVNRDPQAIFIQPESTSWGARRTVRTVYGKAGYPWPKFTDGGVGITGKFVEHTRFIFSVKTIETVLKNNVSGIKTKRVMTADPEKDGKILTDWAYAGNPAYVYSVAKSSEMSGARKITSAIINKYGKTQVFIGSTADGKFTAIGNGSTEQRSGVSGSQHAMLLVAIDEDGFGVFIDSYSGKLNFAHGNAMKNKPPYFKATVPGFIAYNMTDATANFKERAYTNDISANGEFCGYILISK